MIRKILFAVVAVLLLTGEAAAQQKEASPEPSWSALSSDQRALLGNLESQWPTQVHCCAHGYPPWLPLRSVSTRDRQAVFGRRLFLSAE